MYSSLPQKTYITVPWLLTGGTVLGAFWDALPGLWSSNLTQIKISISFLDQRINFSSIKLTMEQKRLKWDPQKFSHLFCEKIPLQYIGEIMFLSKNWCLVNWISIFQAGHTHTHTHKPTHTQKHQPYIKEKLINWTSLKLKPLLIKKHKRVKR